MSELKQHYEEGWTVNELAKKTGYSVSEIRNALRHEFPEVHPTKEFRDFQVTKLHSEGMTDKEMADEMGIRLAYVQTIRNRLKLNQNKQILGESKRKWLYMYLAGWTDEEIAEMLKLSIRTIQDFRTYHKFPENRRD
ncbi:MAG: hypothetical protein KIH03_01655 [Paludibacteraceae bacterium]|nr:hypothetical protein [Paludibacteraceae bacterium]